MIGADENEVVTAAFTFAVYESPDKSWCVCKYRNKDTDREFTAVGKGLPKKKDLVAKLYGRWAANRKTGKREFHVNFFEFAKPSEMKEMVAYFGSLKCGIGRDKAERIFKTFGKNTWDIIENSPERLKEVRGISDKTFESYMAAVAVGNASKQMLSLLSKAQITVSATTLRKVIDALGFDAHEKLAKNPYLAYGIEGFYFDKCEALAEVLQIPKDSPDRTAALIQKILRDSMTGGHVCLPKMELLNELERQSGCAEAVCKTAINQAFQAEAIRQYRSHLYLPENMGQEEEVANKLLRLSNEGDGVICGIDSLIEDYEKANFTLAERQRDAIKMVFSSLVSVITGGPGVGKTTVTKAVLFVHKEIYGYESNPVLLAPTGKAARRMSDATGYPASTIHSAVGWRGDNLPLEHEGEAIDGNLILIDESSMMDQKICSILLEKIKPGSRVVFIGDVDQLPSVGCGYILHDIIESGVIPTTKLNVIYRQSETNPIVTNAHAINEGRTDLIETRTFRFIETTSEGDAFLQACKLYLRCVKAYGDENVVLLNPQRNNTELNVDNFNKTLQKIINPIKPNALTMTVNRTTFRAGDKIMQLKNTEAAKNGDTGYIREIERKPDPDELREWIYTAVIDFGGETGCVRYTAEDLRDVTLAWCTTVHKCQGEEVQTVIQIVSKAHASMLKRNIVYTGITRAKQNVAIIGERDAFEIAVKNNAQETRYTLLAQRLKEKAREKT